MKRIILGIAVLTAALATGSAIAHGPRYVVGLNFGFPIAGYPYLYPYPYSYYYPPYPYYYPASYTYLPAPVVIQQRPTVYIEQQPAPQPQFQPQTQQQAGAGYWYYCAESRLYYPYVRECPAGWQRVAPQPAN